MGFGLLDFGCEGFGALAAADEEIANVGLGESFAIRPPIALLPFPPRELNVLTELEDLIPSRREFPIDFAGRELLDDGPCDLASPSREPRFASPRDSVLDSFLDSLLAGLDSEV